VSLVFGAPQGQAEVGTAAASCSAARCSALSSASRASTSRRNFDRHLPTGRITLEKVIAWCIEYGAPTSCDTIEALDCLAITEASPLLYRSSTDSPEQAGQR
jgi:hypothetical protein